MMSSSLLAFPTVTGTTESSEHITAVMATTDGKYSARVQDDELVFPADSSRHGGPSISLTQNGDGIPGKLGDMWA